MGTKSVKAVKRRTLKVCPHCGHEHFEKKEGFSPLGQQFVCAKCKGTFRKANVVGAQTTDVKVKKR
jgi:transposase-like protein